MIEVQVNDKQLRRLFRDLPRSVVPVVNARAINEVLKGARTKAIREVSGDIKLQQKWIRYRFDQNGQRKGERTVIRKATRISQFGTARVYLRGILVAQVQGAQTKRGVRARGGRFYEGAFKISPRSGPDPLVVKRRPNARKLMAPRIGVRERLTQVMDREIVGIKGRREFDRVWTRIARAQLERRTRR